MVGEAARPEISRLSLSYLLTVLLNSQQVSRLSKVFLPPQTTGVSLANSPTIPSISASFSTVPSDSWKA